MDQRDNAINDLSKLMDVRTVTNSSNEVSVFTTTGVQLVGDQLASKLSFTSPGALYGQFAVQQRPDQKRRRFADDASFRMAAATT